MNLQDLIAAINNLSTEQQDALLAECDRLREERALAFPQIKESIVITGKGDGTASILIDGTEYAKHIYNYGVGADGLWIEWTSFDESGAFSPTPMWGVIQSTDGQDEQRILRVYYPGIQYRIEGVREGISQPEPEPDISPLKVVYRAVIEPESGALIESSSAHRLITDDWQYATAGGEWIGQKVKTSKGEGTRAVWVVWGESIASMSHAVELASKEAEAHNKRHSGGL